MNWADYAAVERQDHNRVSFKMIYVDMTGDLIAGLQQWQSGHQLRSPPAAHCKDAH